MIVQTAIEEKLRTIFSPAALTVLNESHMHSVPPNSETHFKVVVVSDLFAGQRLIARHQAVNAALADELAGPVHALSIQAHTPEEWQKRGGTILDSPDCRGGSKPGAAS